MASVNCECGFVKNEISDDHIGKKAKCPKCGKGVIVQRKADPEPVPVQPSVVAVTPAPAKPEFTPKERIINTDVLLAVLKGYKDRISEIGKRNKKDVFSDVLKGCKDKILEIKKRNKMIPIFLILVVIIGAGFVWKSSFVKKYFFKNEVTIYLKDILIDPDSLKIIKWGEPIPVKEKVRKEYPTLFENAYWEFEVRYSAANQLGGRASKVECFLFNADGKIVKKRDECLIKGRLFN